MSVRVRFACEDVMVSVKSSVYDSPSGSPLTSIWVSPADTAGSRDEDEKLSKVSFVAREVR